MGVELEVVGLNGHRDGLLGESEGKLLLAVGGDIGVASDDGDVLVLLVSRAAEEEAAAGEVLVVILRVDTAVGGDPGEGIVHQAAVAALVLSGVAVQKLLLGEGDELAGLEEVQALNGAGGGNCRRKKEEGKSKFSEKSVVWD